MGKRPALRAILPKIFANRGWRTLGVAATTLIVLLGAAQTTVASPILSISPASVTSNIGDPLTLDIDVTGAADLYAFQFDVGFDPGVLQASDILEGSFLGAGGSTLYIPGTIDNAVGVITFTASSRVGVVSGASGDGALASVLFVPITGGLSLISISNVLLLDSQFNTLEFSTVDGGIRVQDSVPSTPVPEPMTFTLLGPGLAMVGIRRRWRSAARC